MRVVANEHDLVIGLGVNAGEHAIKSISIRKGQPTWTELTGLTPPFCPNTMTSRLDLAHGTPWEHNHQGSTSQLLVSRSQDQEGLDDCKAF